MRSQSADMHGWIRRGMLGLSLLLGMTAMAQTIPYEQLLYLANRAFTQQQYAAAITQYDELLRAVPQGESTDVILVNRAQCCLALKLPAEAITNLERLRLECPESTLLPDGLVQLYRLYRDQGVPDRAQAIWETIAEHWPDSPQMWQLIGDACQEIAAKHPEQAPEIVAWIAPLHLSIANLTKLIYQPLLRANRFEEANAVHKQLLAVLSAKGVVRSQLDDVRRAYQESVTKQAMEMMYQYFTTALAADDLATARNWLANMNTVAPEYPLAVQARKQYREKMAAPPPATTVPTTP